MSLRFSRKNGKKFNNYLLYARVSDKIHAYSVDYMTIYLFQYMGEKAFIRIGCQELKSGKKHFFAIIEKSEKGEPYQFDD